VLIGNKVDHREAGTDRAEVTVEEAKAFAASVGLAYFETSAVSFAVRLAEPPAGLPGLARIQWRGVATCHIAHPSHGRFTAGARWAVRRTI